jgi:CRISPR-associated protein Cas2
MKSPSSQSPLDGIRTPHSVRPDETWWLDAFPLVPYQRSPPGETEVLTLVAYDISDQKRLGKVARVCEDFGVRVQYSVFECRLEEAEFTEFWLQLLGEIDEEEDRLVAYKIDARCAKETMTAGRMVCSEKALCYLV